MRKKVKSNIVCWAVFGTLLLTIVGCAPPRVIYATYTVPPDSVTNSDELENCEIEIVSADVSGSYFSPSEAEMFRQYLEQYLRSRLASFIYKEKTYELGDDIFRNHDGEKILEDALKGYEGRSRIHSDKPEGAKIKVEVSARIDKDAGVDLMETVLVRQPYNITWEEDDGFNVPSSEPNRNARTQRVVVSNVPFIHVTSSGMLRISVESESGAVYERSFSDMEFEKKVGGVGDAAAPPTSLEIAGKLFNKKILEVVHDISPHQVSRLLEWNEKGDKTAIALMKATAFSYAEKRLIEVCDENERVFEEIKAEIQKEFEEEKAEIRQSGKEPEKIEAALEKLEEDKEKEIAREKVFMSPDYENHAICMEVMGKTNQAIDSFKRAVEADPGNSSAGEALGKVEALKARSQQLRNDT